MNRLNAIILFLTCCFPALAQSPPPTDNQRDPLNAHFTANAPTTPSPYTEMTSDARLNDVYFVNPQRGWAVGDRGTIWATTNGGTNWQLQETPIDCPLRSVHFLDESFGIAVGNYWFPSTQQGRGVILTTRDGGQSWKLRHSPDLPPLYHIKIFDTTTMLVAGATSERSPGGLLLSRDGGQNWRPIQTELSDGFAAADFYDTSKGIGIGFHGILQQFQNGISASQTTDLGLRQVAAVKVNQGSGDADVTGWAAGDRGLMLSSMDHGNRWEAVQGTLSGNAAEVVDLKTIEAHGKKLWTAGNPGTCIYMSNDAGQTWEASLTGVPGAIRKIVFIDADTGWAVGDLGTILTTQNGGRTWEIQRTGSTKLAVLGLFGETESIPFEAFAALSATQGFLSGCALLFRNEQNSSEQEHRLHESIVRIGGSIGTELGTFPIRHGELWMTSEKLTAHIQKMTGGKGMAQLRERLVAAIRQWKPDVLLTYNYTKSLTDSAVEEMVLREVMEAVKLANDPSAYPHHLTELGLSRWNVKKIYLPKKNGELGDVNLMPAEPAARFGMPLEQLTFVSRSLVEAKKSPAILGFRDVTPGNTDSSGKSFFAGIPLLQGENGRRKMSGIYTEFYNEHLRRALQRRNVLGILQSTAKTAPESGQPVNRANLAAHAADLTRKLDPDSAVPILLELAEQFQQEGDLSAASETYLILTRQYARHPLVRQAFIQLMQYAASEEITMDKLQNNAAALPEDEKGNDQKRPGQQILQTSAAQESSPLQKPGDSQRDRALLLGQYLDQNIPDLAEEVSMRFATASVLRRLGWEQDAAKFYQMRANLRFDDVWGMRARTEYWLTLHDKSGLPAEQQELPMPVMVSVYTPSKPLLDGKFDGGSDQSVWQRSNVYSLTHAKPRHRLLELLQPEKTVQRVGIIREECLREMSQNFGTQTMFMHDSEYWYIALRCPKVPEFAYPPVFSKQQDRDVDMSQQDRVEILIDTDRDYKTYYSLTIDFRGWVMEACMGDRNWNSRGQVVRHEDGEAWYIEAAIPFSSLLERSMPSNVVWCMAIRRLVPDAGIECWNVENSFALTEGFGLLAFP